MIQEVGMYTEDDLLPLSALQHLVFCERQCALIHVEGQWAENILTAEGAQMHARVDEATTETRGDVRTARGLAVHSFRLGLSGKTDVVEYRRCEEAEAGEAVALAGVDGSWAVAPVEYKRGRPKPDISDKAQLCAQALCLEEMLGVRIPRGTLYYGKVRKRVEVQLDDSLRTETESLAERLHALVRSGRTPKARYEPKCDRCSLIAICMPKVTGPKTSVRGYLAGAWDIREDEGM